MKNSKIAKFDTTFEEDCEIESKFALLLLSDSVWGVALSKQLPVSSSCPVQQKKMVRRCVDASDSYCVSEHAYADLQRLLHRTWRPVATFLVVVAVVFSANRAVQWNKQRAGPFTKHTAVFEVQSKQCSF